MSYGADYADALWQLSLNINVVSSQSGYFRRHGEYTRKICPYPCFSSMSKHRVWRLKCSQALSKHLLKIYHKHCMIRMGACLETFMITLLSSNTSQIEKLELKHNSNYIKTTLFWTGKIMIHINITLIVQSVTKYNIFSYFPEETKSNQTISEQKKVENILIYLK